MQTNNPNILLDKNKGQIKVKGDYDNAFLLGCGQDPNWVIQLADKLVSTVLQLVNQQLCQLWC